jgi:hypothetical protein
LRLHSIAAAAIIALAPQSKASLPANGNGSVRVTETAAAEASPLIFRIRRKVQSDGKNGTVIEVQARITNDEAQDQETASYAYELLDRLASLAGKNPHPPKTSLVKLFLRARQKQRRPSLAPHPPRKGVLFMRSSPRLIA